MPHKGAVQPVIDPGFQIVVSLRKLIVISAEELFRQTAHMRFRAVHRHGRLRLHFQKVGGADQIFRVIRAVGIVNIVQFHAAEDLDPVRIFLLETADLREIRLNVHMNVRIHMSGKSEVPEAELQGLQDHILRRVGSVAEPGVGVKIRK